MMVWGRLRGIDTDRDGEEKTDSQDITAEKQSKRLGVERMDRVRQAGKGEDGQSETGWERRG